jgi:small subunit ribosomal protein S6
MNPKGGSMLQSLRDQPGTKREYETIYILRPETDSEQLQKVNTRLRKVIDEADGKLMRVENWGKRKLAYEIKKHNKGIYLYWRYLAGAELVSELERTLRLLDPVIRYLTVKVDEDVDPEARPSGVTEEVFNAAAETRPDEEDYYLGRAGQRDDGEESGEGEGEGDRRSEAAAAEGDSGEAQPSDEQASSAEGDSGEAQPSGEPAASTEGEQTAAPAAEAAEADYAESSTEASDEEPTKEGE